MAKTAQEKADLKAEKNMRNSISINLRLKRVMLSLTY